MKVIQHKPSDDGCVHLLCLWLQAHMHTERVHQSKITPRLHSERETTEEKKDSVRAKKKRRRKRVRGWPCISRRPVTAGLTAVLLFRCVGVCHYQNLCVCQHNTSQRPLQLRDAKKTLAGAHVCGKKQRKQLRYSFILLIYVWLEAVLDSASTIDYMLLSEFETLCHFCHSSRFPFSSVLEDQWEITVLQLHLSLLPNVLAVIGLLNPVMPFSFFCFLIILASSWLILSSLCLELYP